MSSLHKMVNFNFQLPAMFVFLDFHKSGLIKSCLSFEDLSAYQVSWSHIDWYKVCIHLSSLKIPPWPYSEGPLQRKIIQIILVRMSWSFIVPNFVWLSAMVHELVSIKQNVNFKFQLSAMFVFLVFRKVVLLIVVHPLNTYRNTKIHGPTLTGVSFTFTSEVLTSTILNGYSYSIKSMVLRSPSMAWPPHWIS
jgi:hypothetical protein